MTRVYFLYISILTGKIFIIREQALSLKKVENLILVKRNRGRQIVICFDLMLKLCSGVYLFITMLKLKKLYSMFFNFSKLYIINLKSSRDSKWSFLNSKCAFS